MNKKDISVIRDSIGKIVALLTRRAIKVTQRGTQAYVKYTKSGAISLVNVPYIPDDASDEFVAAIQGFLDHEVGHVLFTDPAVVRKAYKLGGRVKNLANVIEDVFIERRMGETFPGSNANLESVRRFYLDKIAKANIDKALAAGDASKASGYAAVVQFRAWGGQQIAADFLADNPAIAELNKPLIEKLEPEIIAKIIKANSSQACLDLACVIKERLDPAKPAPEPEEPAASPPGPSKGSEPPEKDEDSDGGDDETGESEDAGTTSAESDDSDTEREESSTSEHTAEESGSVVGTDEPEELPDGDDAEPAEPSEPGPPTPSIPGDEPMEFGAEEEPDEPAEPDDAGPSEAAGEGDEATESAPIGTSSESAESEDPEIAEDGDAGTPGEREKPGEPGTSETTSDGDPEPDLDLGEAFDEEHDFDEDMSKALSEEARLEIKKSQYKIFSTDWDEVEPAPLCPIPHAIEVMIDEVEPMVSAMQKGLERAMAAKARKSWNPGQRRGRINPGALFRTAVGDDRVFRQRYETQAKNTVVSLVLDCSGSMTGAKMKMTGKAAYALSATLERLKIKHEIIGFTTRVSSEMRGAIREEGEDGVEYARREALYIPVFKGFGDRLDSDVKSRLANLTANPSWLRENVDGECVKLAAHRLLTQLAERHVMLVLSDGSPACGAGDYEALQDHLKTTVDELNKSGQLEIVGIGILDSAVRHFYDKHVVLRDLQALPTEVMGQLSKILLTA